MTKWLLLVWMMPCPPLQFLVMGILFRRIFTTIMQRNGYMIAA